MNFLVSVITYLTENWMTGWMGMLLYWLPLAVCVVGYTLRTSENLQKDYIVREKYRNYLKRLKELEGDEKETDNFKKSCRNDSVLYASYYSPTDKIGTLIGRALVTIIPFANLWAGVFDISPRLFKRLIETIEKIFDTPLVPQDKGM